VRSPTAYGKKICVVACSAAPAVIVDIQTEVTKWNTFYALNITAYFVSTMPINVLLFFDSLQRHMNEE
jgi:hypothetical protein